MTATEDYLLAARRYLAVHAREDDPHVPRPRRGPSIVPLLRSGPRYWPTALGASLLRVAALAPYPVRVRLGRALGAVSRRVFARRRRIARANLQHCFPHLDARERERLLAEHFAAFGIALFEMGAVWWAPAERLSPLVRFEGLEHLRAVLAAGRGAILLSGHFASMEMGVAHFARIIRSNVIYRPHNDPVIDALIERGRTRYPGRMIRRDDFRGMVRALQRNEPVWFSPDQDFGRRHSIYARFFGQRAATINATARLARVAGAPVLPFFTRRLPGLAGYEVVIGPALEAFPSGDEALDAQAVNDVLEAAIVRDIPQYLWVHRRFKTQPAGTPDLYAP